MAGATYGYAVDIVLLSLIIIYMVTSFLEVRLQLNFLTEFSVGILLGLMAAIIFSYLLHLDVQFIDKNFFFFILLPMILFSQGYLIKKRYFFRYMFYISLFGLFGTLASFFMIYLSNILINYLGWIHVGGVGIELSTQQLFIFSAVMSSCEPLTSKLFVNQNDNPKLYNILYGERNNFNHPLETMNDIVVFCLVVGAISTLSKTSTSTIEWYTYLLLIVIILIQVAVTTLVGLAIGLVLTLLTKYCRFLLHSDFGTCCFIIYFGFMSFSLSKSFNLVGVVSVIFSAIVISHYMVYNISIEAQQLTISTIKMLAQACECLIAFLLGITLCNIAKAHFKIPWSFVFLELFIITVVRFVMVFGSVWLVKILGIKKESQFYLNKYELLFVAFSGLFRGPIVVALTQYIDMPKQPSGDQGWPSFWLELTKVQTLTTTGLMMVLVTNFVYGALLQPIATACLAHADKRDKAQDEHEEEQEEQQHKKKPPVFQKTKTLKNKEKHWFFYSLKNFDRLFLKKMLIYDYENRKDQLKQEKQKYKEQHKEHGHGHGHDSNNGHLQHSKSAVDSHYVSHKSSVNMSHSELISHEQFCKQEIELTVTNPLDKD